MLRNLISTYLISIVFSTVKKVGDLSKDAQVKAQQVSCLFGHKALKSKALSHTYRHYLFRSYAILAIYTQENI